MKTTIIISLFFLYFTTGCRDNQHKEEVVFYDTAVFNKPFPEPELIKPAVDTGSVLAYNSDREKIVEFAESLYGTPYKYGSTDPALGFDCSGFITHVFNHFKIKVPRSSIDFTNVGKVVELPEARRGDLILFTGTDSAERFVGHMGIVTQNTDTLKFIHSSSGKANGVTITPLNKYYQGRFLKIINIYQ